MSAAYSHPFSSQSPGDSRLDLLPAMGIAPSFESPLDRFLRNF
jgi:hypothetical protein